MTPTGLSHGGTVPPIRYVGMLRSVASWAKVARELIIALRNAGVHVCVQERADDRFDPDFQLPVQVAEVLRTSCQVPDAAHVTVTFSEPGDYAQLPMGSASIGLLAWEASQWPDDWLAAARRHASRIVVPSAFPAQTLVDSGFPRERIGVVPHGVDQARFSPGDRQPPGSRELLTLLFVGTPARRKGLDVLVEAIRQAFPGGGIRLVVKMAPYTDAESRPYLDPLWRNRLATLEAGGHQVDIIDEVISEQDMAQLYRAADLLCHPFRGECFPLPFLEAMACGTPLLCTAWSGPLDLLDAETALLVPPAGQVPAAPMLPEPGIVPPTATMAEPDLSAVVRQLRTADDRRDLLGLLGGRAHRLVLDWTWAAAAEHLVREARIAFAQAGAQGPPAAMDMITPKL